MFRTFFGRKAAGRKSSLFVLFLALANHLCSQNYPVQAGISLLPPHNDQWSLLYTEADKLSVSLLHKDLASPTADVFLRIRIEGPGLIIETDPLYKSSASITLTAGIPTVLSGTDISDILDPSHLQFQGISKADFITSGMRLPHGMYRFSVRAFEYSQGQVLSNWGNYFCEIAAPLPPIINFPAEGSVVASQTPQYLNIQFFPRHSLSPGLDLNVQYRIRLAEILPSSRNANEVMLSTQIPFFETITGNSTFVYGPGEPPLVEGRSYALQIQAIDISGKIQFENDGFSQVHRFLYGASCALPKGLTAENSDGNSAFVQWEKESGHRAFLLEYRPKGKGFWKSEMVFQKDLILNSLVPGSVYEIRVAGLCSESQSLFGNAVEIRIDSGAGAYETWKGNHCGKTIPEFDLKNKKALAVLTAGDKIKAADFDITVLAADGSNGIFSGNGTVLLPYTGKIPIPCYFNDVAINSDLRMVAGKIEILRKPLEISGRTGSNIAKKWNAIYGKNWNQCNPIKYSGGISKISKGSDGRIEVDGSDGKRYFNSGMNYEFTDAGGFTYYVSSAGKVSKAEGPKGSPIVADTRSGEGTPSVIPAGVPRVNFYSMAEKGYDAWDLREQTAGLDYDKLDCKDSAYYAGWKLLRASELDTVWGSFFQGKKDKIHPDSIHFSRSDGTILTAIRDGGEYKIVLTGRMNLYADALWAWYYQSGSFGSPKRVIIGKLNLVNVDERRMNIVLVPVNSIATSRSAEQIQEELNNKLQGQGMEFTVSLRNRLNVPEYAEGSEMLTVERNALGLVYSKSLQRFITSLELREPWLEDNYEGDTAYFFLLGKCADDGYMGLNRKYGFLFLNGNSNFSVRTLAHETGHGLGILEHSFDDPTDAGASMNLMDYSPPFFLLNHAQWLSIFDKERSAVRKMNLSQNAAEGKMVKGKLYSLYSLNIPDKNVNLNFIAPNGKIFTLPADSIQGISFTRAYVRAGSVLLTKDAGNANGVLTYFQYGNQTYGFYSDQNGFHGYFLDCDPRKARLDVARFYSVSDGSEAAVYAGYEDSSCQLLIRSGNYTNSNKTDTLISAATLTGFDILATVDLDNACLEYFEEETLTKAAKHWWGLAKLNPKFRGNEAQCKRIVRLIHDLGEDYKYFDFDAYRTAISKYNIRFVPDFADPLTPFESKALRSFENYLRGSFYAMAKQQEFLSRITDAHELGGLLCTAPASYLQQLSLRNRMWVLRILSKGGLTGEFNLYYLVYENVQEDIALSVIKNTPDNQVSDLLDSLSANVSCAGFPSMLCALCADALGFDGESYTQFNEVLLRWIKRFRPPPESFNLSSAMENSSYLTFKSGYFFGDKTDYEFDDIGNVKLHSRRQFTYNTQDFNLHAYSWIYVKFLDDFKYGEAEFKSNSVARFPAIMVYTLFNEQHNANLKRSGKIAADVVLLAVGVGELRAAMAAGSGVWNTWRKSKALLEIGLAIPDLILTNGLGDVLNKTVSGQAFMEHWNTIQMYFGIGSLADAGLTGVVKKLYREYKDLKALKNLDPVKEKELDDIIELLEKKTGVLRSEKLLLNAGKLTRGGKNLLQLEAPTGLFRQLVDKKGNYHRAADFWKNESDGIEHFLTQDGRYYIKRDPANGRTLFIDVEKEAFVGWHLDDDGIFKGDYEALTKTFCSVHGLPGGLREIRIGNVVIDLASDKFNVILGRFDLSAIPGFESEIGTKQIIEQISLLKNYSFASKNYELAPGALHVLNIPDGMSELAKQNGSDFWEAFNKHFLDLVIENKERANVIFVTDPRVRRTLMKYEAGEFQEEAAFFGRELKLLKSNGVEMGLLFNGDRIRLSEIDLEWIEL